MILKGLEQRIEATPGFMWHGSKWKNYAICNTDIPVVRLYIRLLGAEV